VKTEKNSGMIAFRFRQVLLYKGNIKRISLYEQNITQYSIIYVGLSLIEALIRATDLFVLQTVEIRLKYTGCPRRNVPNFGRVFLMLNYNDITQNTYVQS